MYCSPSRVGAIVIRHLYLQVRDLLRLFDITYWPGIEVLLWGFGSTWLIDQGASSDMLLATVLCITFWEVMYRTNLEISTNILEEIWERNVMNLFCTPLSFFDWMIGLMVLSVIRVFLVFCTCALVAWFCFEVSLFYMGIFRLSAIVASLIFSGWIIGFLNSSFAFYLGRKAQTFPWMFGWLWAPICGAFYDINVMPSLIQKISFFIPMTYVFQSVRHYVVTKEFHYDGIVTCMWVGSVYMVISLYILYSMFKKSKVNGLSTLEM